MFVSFLKLDGYRERIREEFNACFNQLRVSLFLFRFYMIAVLGSDICEIWAIFRLNCQVQPAFLSRRDCNKNSVLNNLFAAMARHVYVLSFSECIRPVGWSYVVINTPGQVSQYWRLFKRRCIFFPNRFIFQVCGTVQTTPNNISFDLSWCHEYINN